MITNVSLITVWVKDMDESKAFWTDVLGFNVGDDIEVGPDFRWLTVTHPSQPELEVHLSIPGPPLSPDLVDALVRAQADGGLPALGLKVDDCRATHAELVAKGVEFIQPPEDRPYGVEALMRDNSGNWIVLVESREYTPEEIQDGLG